MIENILLTLEKRIRLALILCFDLKYVTYPGKGDPPRFDPLPASPLKPTPPRFLLWRSMRAERPRDLIRVSGEEAETEDGGPPLGKGLDNAREPGQRQSTGE